MNRVTHLLGIKHPIIQAGMVWCSGWKLASAASNNGILGVIGAGSMYPDVLKLHIQKCKKATQFPFAVNIPLFYPQIEELFEILFEEGVEIVITSGGNPGLYTQRMKNRGIKVMHVIANVKFAKKAQDAGVDAVIAEGFEAGGHNGRDEITTMCLVPSIIKAVKIPVIAAGGIGTGRSMLAAMSLGAEGVQIGSRFAISKESSAHDLFKEYVLSAKDGDTVLTLKELAPVRMLKNEFYSRILKLYQKGTNKEELKELLGRSRIKKGIFEGDLIEGNLEIGQISAIIESIDSVKTIVQEIIMDYESAKLNLFSFHD
ncbi:MAG: nitronate monooxygenase [Flavobacteriales bacterium]|nr:nitronate monooxygenase [Flavobacteriales bacterium]|tara:strand:- start:17176 stop:18120 length:945 start_codon:yes stop_codon:yes gene_type:complete